VRLEAIRELLDAGLELDLFEQEFGQVDGTFAHAVERVVASVIESTGYHLCGVTSTGELVPPAAVHPYPFAKSTQ
jgi:lipopolysaccharide biosynthesis protein